MIVLNPFLDSLCNLGFKNIGLTPGILKGCFQHPQDIVYLLKALSKQEELNFCWDACFLIFFSIWISFLLLQKNSYFVSNHMVSKIFKKYVSKGGLISESFYLWFHPPKVPITNLNFYLGGKVQDSDLPHFLVLLRTFWD